MLWKDLGSGLRRFFDHVEPYRLQWIQERIVVEPWPRASFRLPTWQAHRGYWLGGAAQNTLGALREARLQGAEMCEFDVRLTKDSVAVLFHDEDLQIIGRSDLKVADLNFQDLRELLKKDRRVSTLREVLADDQVPALLNIELKAEETVNNALERVVADEVIRAGAENRVLFSSFNPFSIWKVQGYLPQVPRALLVTREGVSRPLKEMWLAPFLRIHMLNLDKEMVDELSMKTWQKLNVPIAVWTAKDPAEIRHYLNLGVASVISDVVPS